MRRRQRLPFHTEHEIMQVTTVRSSDSKCSAEGRLGSCRMCLQAPVFRSHSLTVCTPQINVSCLCQPFGCKLPSMLTCADKQNQSGCTQDNTRSSTGHPSARLYENRCRQQQMMIDDVISLCKLPRLLGVLCRSVATAGWCRDTGPFCVRLLTSTDVWLECVYSECGKGQSQLPSMYAIGTLSADPEAMV